MKSLFTILLIQSALNGSAQYLVPEKPIEPVYAIYPHILDSATNTEYMYDDSTVLVCTIQWIDTLQFYRRVTYYYENGNKYEEYSEKNHRYCDTLRQWTKDGLLSHLRIYSDTGYTSFDFRTATGKIFQVGNYALINDTLKSLVIRDSSTFDVYESVACNQGCTVPCGRWSTFHENGLLESEGKYLSREFNIVYPTEDSAGIAVTVKKTSFDTDSYFMGILCSARLKDGTWLYYDSNGNLIREEFYEGGLLKSTRNFN